MSKYVLVVGGKQIPFVDEKARSKAEEILREICPNFAESPGDDRPSDTVSAYLKSGRPLAQSGLNLKERACAVMHFEIPWDRPSDAEDGEHSDD
jgi:hypothetical protein